MPAQLVALTDGASILLDKPILLVGRHPESDIQINSRKISRLHCCIAQVSDYLVVRDLGSTNGIRINSVRVVEGTLHEGDELTIGNHRYTVQWDGVARKSGLGKAIVKEPGKIPPAPRPIDELLEACEEPIPLSEGGNAAVAAPKRPAPRAPAAEHPTANVPPSRVVPDDLKLAPASDSLHPPPSPAH